MTVRMWVLLGAVTALMTALGLAYVRGGDDARDDAALEAAEDYRDGRKDTDNATRNLPADDDGRREWLRNYGR